jgi:hypothetical protein
MLSQAPAMLGWGRDPVTWLLALLWPSLVAAVVSWCNPGRFAAPFRRACAEVPASVLNNSNSMGTRKNRAYIALAWLMNEAWTASEATAAPNRRCRKVVVTAALARGDDIYVDSDDEFAGVADYAVVLPSDDVPTPMRSPGGLGTFDVVHNHDVRTQAHRADNGGDTLVDNSTFSVYPAWGRGWGWGWGWGWGREQATPDAFVVEALRRYDAHLAGAGWVQKYFDTVASRTRWDMGRKLGTRRTWDTVALPAAERARLEADLAGFVASEAWYAQRGISWTRGYLLSGPPGTGKTSLVRAMSHAARLDIYALSLGAGMTDQALASLFRELPPRCVLLIEDVDCTVKAVLRRSGGADAETDADADADAVHDAVHNVPAPSFGKPGQGEITLSCLLNLLDGVCSGHGRVVVMTSNYPERLDPALVRPGRCDVKVDLTWCTLDDVVQLVDIVFGKAALPNVRQRLQAAWEARTAVRVVAADVMGAMLPHKHDAAAALDAVARLLGGGL